MITWRKIKLFFQTLFCIHLYVDGFGGMGDAVACTKCGYCFYKNGTILSELIFRYISCDHKHYKKYSIMASEAMERRDRYETNHHHKSPKDN